MAHVPRVTTGLDS